MDDKDLSVTVDTGKSGQITSSCWLAPSCKEEPEPGTASPADHPQRAKRWQEEHLTLSLAVYVSQVRILIRFVICVTTILLCTQQLSELIDLVNRSPTKFNHC